MSGMGERLAVMIRAAVMLVVIAGAAALLLVLARGPAPRPLAPARLGYPVRALTPAPSPAPGPSPGTVTLEPSGIRVPVAACAAAGGEIVGTITGAPACSDIPYYGTDGMVYYTSAVPVTGEGALEGPAATAGTGATRAECESGYYPDSAIAGQVRGAPGQWDAGLALCLADPGKVTT